MSGATSASTVQEYEAEIARLQEQIAILQDPDERRSRNLRRAQLLGAGLDGTV